MSIANNLFGKSISCFSHDRTKRDAFLSDYCWYEGTMTLTEVKPHSFATGMSFVIKNKEDSEYQGHHYYQWVAIFLTLQVCFHHSFYSNFSN